MIKDDWTTIFIAHDEIEANLKKGLLENAGIQCVIEANIYRPRSVAPLYNEFKLNVLKDDQEEAEEILKAVQ